MWITARDLVFSYGFGLNWKWEFYCGLGSGARPANFIHSTFKGKLFAFLFMINKRVFKGK